jgi:sugar/nucleoside kinase (ribokinase family)
LVVGRLVVYGDIGLDVVVQAKTLPRHGQDTIAEAISLFPGGSAANCAAIAGRLGACTEFLGVTGSDSTADLLVADLVAHGVRTTGLRRTIGDTTVVVDIVTPGQDPAFYSYRGVARTEPFGELHLQDLGPDDFIHLSGYCFQDELSSLTAQTLLRHAAECGARISLDPSYHFARRCRSDWSTLLKNVDLVFPNREEARLMGDSSDPAIAARSIMDWGPEIVVIKSGRRGCYLVASDFQDYVKPYDIEDPVDTTGAGDAFCGGFLFAAMIGLEPHSAAKIGHAAANFVIRKPGAHAGAPTLPDLADFLRRKGEVGLAARLSAPDLKE